MSWLTTLLSVWSTTLHGVGVGDAEAVLEACLDIGLGKRAGDGFAAAMHNDDFDADRMIENAMSVATRVRTAGSASSMKAPPYLTTKIASRKRWIYGSASSSTADFGGDVEMVSV